MRKWIGIAAIVLAIGLGGHVAYRAATRPTPQQVQQARDSANLYVAYSSGGRLYSAVIPGLYAPTTKADVDDLVARLRKLRPDLSPDKVILFVQELQ